MVPDILMSTLAEISPFGASSEVREYLPLIVVLVVGALTYWLWLKVKRQASDSGMKD